VTSFVANIADPLLKKDAKSSVETSLSSIPVGNLSDSRTLEVHQTFNRTESKTKNNLTIPSKPAESVTASLSALSTFVSEIEKEPKLGNPSTGNQIWIGGLYKCGSDPSLIQYQLGEAMSVFVTMAGLVQIRGRPETNQCHVIVSFEEREAAQPQKAIPA
jgi:hypothetical protein